ncbi:carbohydrate esterase family 4 protein [Durotheca rogersii]|uniref:carbohydrate esterase family 4 protein n=1 Tax=Durotheca rogersii TaxID=419775 RepID=UPI00221F2FE6|nr:carbohydrate esterase family 4 protein [Durotheca rogersii]KAI5863852.1 carbohydrate esterase family 4 protein [Durotheca rogersii]
MLFESVVALALALSASAKPVPSPIDVIKRDHVAGIVINKCAKPGVLTLAYDDGPYQYTSSLVDTLNNAGVKGTFFLTGTLYGCIYNQRAAVKKAYDSGHQIASHTWTHPHVGSLGAAQIRSEMERVEQAFVNIFGRKPQYVRPPYLETGGQFLGVMRELNYTVVTNDVDAGDWNNQSPQQSQQRFQQAGAAGDGHIPLMHETYQGTVTTLTSWLIAWARSNNLQIVTVAECLNDAEGAYKPGTFEGNGQTTC